MEVLKVIKTVPKNVFGSIVRREEICGEIGPTVTLEAPATVSDTLTFIGGVLIVVVVVVVDSLKRGVD